MARRLLGSARHSTPMQSSSAQHDAMFHPISRLFDEGASLKRRTRFRSVATAPVVAVI